MLPSQSRDAGVSMDLRRSLHDHWGVFTTEGVVLVVLGIAAIVLPVVAGLAVTLVLGWLFLAAGVIGLMATLRMRNAPGFGWSLLSALAALAAGIVLLWDPLAGLVTLTYVLTAYFVVDGIFIIAYAISHRREFSGRWEWMLVNGIVDLVLAGIIISGMPGSFAWVLGVLVGIDLLFGGTALIAMALEARSNALR